MSQRIKQLHSDLETHLRNIFRNVSEGSGEYLGEYGKFSQDYRAMQDNYDESRDTGTFVVGTDEDPMYAYRMRFNGKSSKPKYIYWFHPDDGFCVLNRAVGEKKYIMDILTKIGRKTDIVTQEDIDTVSDIYDEIEDEVTFERQKYDISDVKSMIMNKEMDTLRDIISPNTTASIELWKLLYSKSSEGKIGNSVDCLYRDENRAFFRSIRTYHGSNETNEYPVYVYIEETNTMNSFFVHRIPRNSVLDRPIETSRDMNNVLGCRLDAQNDQVDTINKTTKITSNIIVEPKQWRDQYTTYRDYVHKDILNAIHAVYHDFYFDKKSFDFSFHTRTHRFEIPRDYNTQKVKDVQGQLGISEKKVRNVQQRRNIGRLSSNLRADIIEDLYLVRLINWISKRPVSELIGHQEKYNDNHRMSIARRLPNEIGNQYNFVDDISDMIINYPQDINRRNLYDMSNRIADTIFNDFEDKGSLSRVHQAKSGKISIDGQISKHPAVKQIEGYSTQHIQRYIVHNQTELIHMEEMNSIDTFTLEPSVYDIKELAEVNTIRY